MSNDNVPFDASVSSKTVLNLKKKWQRRTSSHSIQIWTFNAREMESMFICTIFSLAMTLMSIFPQDC
jgi:hypothetical protein